jgi:hypothetical protein
MKPSQLRREAIQYIQNNIKRKQTRCLLTPLLHMGITVRNSPHVVVCVFVGEMEACLPTLLRLQVHPLTATNLVRFRSNSKPSYLARAQKPQSPVQASERLDLLATDGMNADAAWFLSSQLEGSGPSLDLPAYWCAPSCPFDR